MNDTAGFMPNAQNGYPLEPQLQNGSRLGKYTVLSKLGSGGNGVVYLAFDPQLNRRVAIKTLHSYAGFPEVNEFQRFIREGKILANLKHENIAQVFDFFKNPVNNMPAIAMELIDGDTLESLVKQRVKTGNYLSLEETCGVIQQISSALDAAHEQGIIHRDVKPANIIREKSTGNYKLLDFGAARVANGQSLTHTGGIIGTPVYMAPEQAECKKELISPQTDVYGLAGVAFFCLTGESPVKHSVGSYATFIDVMGNKIQPLSELRPNLEKLKSLEEVIVKSGLAKDVNDRPISASEFYLSLLDIAKSEEKPSERKKLGLLGGLASLALVTMAGLGLSIAHMSSNSKSIDDTTKSSPVSSSSPNNTNSESGNTGSLQQLVTIKANRTYNKLRVIASPYELNPGSIYLPSTQGIFLDPNNPTKLLPGNYQLEVSADGIDFKVPFKMPKTKSKEIFLQLPHYVPATGEAYLEFTYVSDAENKSKPVFLSTKNLPLSVILPFITEEKIHPHMQKYHESYQFISNNESKFNQRRLSSQDQRKYIKLLEQMYYIEKESMAYGPSTYGVCTSRSNLYRPLVHLNLISHNEFDRVNPLTIIYPGANNKPVYALGGDRNRIGKYADNTNSFMISGLRGILVKEFSNWRKHKEFVKGMPPGYTIECPPSIEVLKRIMTGEGILAYGISNKLTTQHSLVGKDDHKDFRHIAPIGLESPHGVKDIIKGAQYARAPDGRIVLYGYTTEGLKIIRDINKNVNRISPSAKLRYVLVPRK